MINRLNQIILVSSIVLSIFSASSAVNVTDATAAAATLTTRSIPVTTTTVQTNQGSQDVVRSADASMNNGLNVLYRMTRTFLDVVQPPGKNYYETFVGKGEFTTVDAAVRSLIPQKNEIPQVLSYFAGFAACVAFGVVFIIVMPIAGLCVCLCRSCCHKCGHEEIGSPEKPRDKPKRVCLGVFLLIFTIIILAGAICAFMSNELVRRRTSSPSGSDSRSQGGQDGSLISVLVDGLGEIDDFKNNTVQEAKDLIQSTNSTLYKILDKVYGFPEVLTSGIINLIRTDLSESIGTLNTTLTRLVSTLRVVDTKSVELRSLYSTLNQSLVEIQRNLSMLCASKRCTAPDLTVDVDLNQVPNLTSVLTDLESVLNRDVDLSSLNKTAIANRIRQEMKPVFDAIDRVDISGTIKSVSQSIESLADKVPSLTPLTNTLNQSRGDVDKYGNYRYYVCVAIGSFLLLIVLLNSLGLCVGACAKPPYDSSDSSGVTRWTAGHCLLASAGLMFIFCCFLMCIIIILFVSGGVIYTEGCRGFDKRQDNILVKMADIYLNASLGNVSFYGILGKCEQNSGIVDAFNLDQIFNISGRLNIQELDNLDIENKFNISSINMSQFDLSEIKSELTKLANSSMSNINFTAFEDMLNKSVPRLSFRDDIDSLNRSADNTTDPLLKASLRDIALQLQHISDTLVVRIINTTNSLQVALANLKDAMRVNNSSQTIPDFLNNMVQVIDRAVNKLKNETPALLMQLIKKESSDIITTATNAVNRTKTQVMTGVGRCKPLADSVQAMISSVCYSTLDPYNSFWFSYGWCLFFFIPTIAVAVALATLYFRAEGQHASCYDAYKSPYHEEYLRLKNLGNYEQDSTPPASGQGSVANRGGYYGNNPGYIDYGDNIPRNGNPGMNFYRGVSHPGNGSYDNRSYTDTEPSNFHIPRPAADSRDGVANHNGIGHRF